MGGDFNTVRYSSKRACTNRIKPGMRDFSDFIFLSGLIDLSLEDGHFTGQILSPNPFWMDFYSLRL